ncbi:FAD binding domain-containing protein [Sporormia fimetaria CBS 119925]|uniref:FAD binding domain-containing protein n=1 Tax=Sporormia fimetaria CBS 119925 TaxID=1340428 RepID=A0A6A6VLP8_9PLEO|nr:FAD binding domain-containing protein [Sporormia fimetaria CBS 119925]
MKSFVSVAALLSAALAQSTFEPSDFNVTEALLKNGVDCTSLKIIFGNDQVETRSESSYTSFVNAFWSNQQREIKPECIFKPEKALDVSTAVLISRLTDCPFAAKSGGHSPVPGGSNINGGITISFEKMNSLAISSDKKVLSFQPGHTWLSVYTFAEKQGVAVNGGRVSTVGVGGLTLGGGISYTSSANGLACDNVVSFEVVTASGIIINVSETQYADLYWALRGGGNNFGLVTKFNLEAFPLGQVWGGQRIYTQEAMPALIDAYFNLGQQEEDPKAHQILSFAFSAPNVALAIVELEYVAPVANATVMAEYNAINSPTIADTTGIKTLARLTTGLDESGASSPGRQLFITWSTKLDKDLATITKDIFYEELPTISDAAGLVPALSLQVLTKSLLQKTKKRGGNPLGLDPASGPLMNCLIAFSWTNKADDSRIHKFAERVRSRSVAAATAKGKSYPYLYMNYAAPWQNPIESYGSANKARLLNIAQKYDPTEVFQQLQPGYFKLQGAPMPMP